MGPSDLQTALVLGLLAYGGRLGSKRGGTAMSTDRPLSSEELAMLSDDERAQLTPMNLGDIGQAPQRLTAALKRLARTRLALRECEQHSAIAQGLSQAEAPESNAQAVARVIRERNEAEAKLAALDQRLAGTGIVLHRAETRIDDLLSERAAQQRLVQVTEAKLARIVAAWEAYEAASLDDGDVEHELRDAIEAGRGKEE
jgi:hypothetical protein